MKSEISSFMYMCWMAEDFAIRALPMAEQDDWIRFYKEIMPPYHKSGVFHYFIQSCWY